MAQTRKAGAPAGWSNGARPTGSLHFHSCLHIMDVLVGAHGKLGLLFADPLDAGGPMKNRSDGPGFWQATTLTSLALAGLAVLPWAAKAMYTVPFLRFPAS